MTGESESLAVVIDLGGSRLKAGVADVATLEIMRRADPRPSGSTWNEAVAAVRRAVDDLHPAPGGPVAVGLAMPGVIDGGQVLSLPGKLAGAEGSDVVAEMKEASRGGRVVVLNDAVAAAIGEAATGAGSSAERTLVITLGTGVGVCVVQDHGPVGDGPFGGGLLGGQIPIGGDHEVPAEARTWTDTAGRRGTIEARVRAGALIAHAALEGMACSTTEEVVTASDAGDERAVAATRRYRDDVVRAIVALAHAHAPDYVVVGGGVNENGSFASRDVEAAVNGELAFGLGVRVRPAMLAADAALVGLAVALGTRR